MKNENDHLGDLENNIIIYIIILLFFNVPIILINKKFSVLN